jgi:hypothetical protein
MKRTNSARLPSGARSRPPPERTPDLAARPAGTPATPRGSPSGRWRETAKAPSGFGLEKLPTRKFQATWIYAHRAACLQSGSVVSAPGAGALLPAHHQTNDSPPSAAPCWQDCPYGAPVHRGHLRLLALAISLAVRRQTTCCSPICPMLIRGFRNLYASLCCSSRRAPDNVATSKSAVASCGLRGYRGNSSPRPSCPLPLLELLTRSR